ncbi:MAG: exo-alpha-sialidase [Clostridia bacterium]|nr:exo-alpha-sialidase [Clostridia bacterium]
MLIFQPDLYFPQCHASCLLPLDHEQILCVYFAGSHEKANDVGIWLSEYDSLKWLPPRLIAKLNDEPHWNPVIFPVKNGIRLVFKVGKEIPHWRSYTMISHDNGRTWSSPAPYTDNPAGGPVRSKPLRLSSGELLAPNSDENGAWLPRVDVSTNEGLTFERRAQIPVNLVYPAESDYICGRGAIQPTLWESEPNHVHALLRTSAGTVYRSDSTDGGRIWKRAYPLAVPNNNSGIDVARAPDGRLFLALNPTSGDFVKRTPLCIFESNDNGNTFYPFQIVNGEPLNEWTGETAEFSYPSLVLKEQKLHLSYTYNRKSIAYWTCAIPAKTEQGRKL